MSDCKDVFNGVFVCRSSLPLREFVLTFYGWFLNAATLSGNQSGLTVFHFLLLSNYVVFPFSCCCSNPVRDEGSEHLPTHAGTSTHTQNWNTGSSDLMNRNIKFPAGKGLASENYNMKRQKRTETSKSFSFSFLCRSWLTFESRDLD